MVCGSAVIAKKFLADSIPQEPDPSASPPLFGLGIKSDFADDIGHIPDLETGIFDESPAFNHVKKCLSDGHDFGDAALPEYFGGLGHYLFGIKVGVWRPMFFDD